jgi:hypothetical protein
MVVLNQSNSDNPLMYDLSFMYTKRCDLRCSFCMYNSGPEVTENLDLEKLRAWLATVDMSKIASFGVYGGEVSVAIDGYRAIMEMLSCFPPRPHFCITNGAWSTSLERTREFLRFCSDYRMFVVISGTPEHRKFQNREVIEMLKAEQPDAIRLKPLEENFHAMGRLIDLNKPCTQKCFSWNRALRIAVQPNGTIIYQNCDGVYPIVGTIDEPFDALHARITNLRAAGFMQVCPHAGAANSSGQSIPAFGK